LLGEKAFRHGEVGEFGGQFAAAVCARRHRCSVRLSAARGSAQLLRRRAQAAAGGGGIHHRTPSGRTVHTKDRRGWLLTGSELHRRSVLLPEPLVRIFSLLATSALLVRAGSTP
jgi:hypothetical protein